MGYLSNTTGPVIGEPVCDVVVLWCCGAVAGPAVRRSRNLDGQEGAFSESQSDHYHGDIQQS